MYTNATIVLRTGHSVPLFRDLTKHGIFHLYFNPFGQTSITISDHLFQTVPCCQDCFVRDVSGSVLLR